MPAQNDTSGFPFRLPGGSNVYHHESNPKRSSWRASRFDVARRGLDRAFRRLERRRVRSESDVRRCPALSRTRISFFPVLARSIYIPGADDAGAFPGPRRSISPESRRVKRPSPSNNRQHRTCMISRPPAFTDRCCRLVSGQLPARSGKNQPPPQLRPVVANHTELQPHLIRAEATAGQTRHLDRLLASLIPCSAVPRLL
jgi:hypothetical protein